MLVIPVMGGAGWRNPPIITISLIVINCLVFFMFQHDDSRQQGQAMLYYMESGLEKIELSAYIDYLRAGRKNMASLPDVEKMDGQLHAHFFGKMLLDTKFQDLLEHDQIIKPDDEQYAHWRNLSEVFNAKRSQVTIWRFGFKPAYHRLDTFITYMFLHGGFGHLLGNMLVLWFVGVILEMGCGRLWYPVIYIPGGLAAVCLFWAVYPHSTMPLVGASGAIAALMGAFAVLYGAKKIKIFYTLGFYFGYRQVYGFALLPFWLGNELYQLFYGGVSNVAYVAHIGGLIGGGLLGLACRQMHGTGEAAEELFREEAPDEISPLIEQANEKLGRLDFDGARLALEEVLKKAPGHRQALQQLFTVERHQPETPRFHAAAERLIGFLTADRATCREACRMYGEYSAAAKSQRLSAGLYVKVGAALIDAGQISEAEKLFSALLRQKPGTPGLPSALLKLADGFRKKNLPEKAAACLNTVCAKYPETPAARIAATALAPPGGHVTG